MANHNITSIVWQRCVLCQGSGRHQGRQCHDCRGSGQSYFFRQSYLFWRRNFSYLGIALRGFEKIVEMAVNGVLFLLFIINLLIVWLILSGVGLNVDALFQELRYSNDVLVGVFWLLLATHCYFFYRLMRRSDHLTINRIYTRTYRHPPTINIADHLSADASLLLDKVWSVVEGRKVQPVRSLHIAEQVVASDDVILLCARLGLNIKQLTQIMARQAKKLLPEKADQDISQPVVNALLQAFVIAADNRHPEITMMDLFLALVIGDETVAEVLYDYGIEHDAIINVIRWIDIEHRLRRQYRTFIAASHNKPKGPINRAFTATATPYLDNFSRDLTQAARVGALPLNISRDEQLEQLYRILQSGQSGALLVGEAGVGKESIIEELANRMASEDVPSSLQDKRLVSISVPLIVAGASETGELQARLISIFNEAMRSGNIIFYIENVHNLVGISSQGTESLDLSDVLASLLKNNRLMLLATTSPKEYKESIERSALGQSLKVIKIGEPERNQTLQILEANAGYWEGRYNVFFTYQALEKAVDLSDRYLHEQFLPAKAINVLEETAAIVSAQAGKKQLSLVSAESVAQVLSAKTNIPLTQMTAQESDKLLHLEEIIHKRIVGQEEAVSLVVSALQRARTELRDKKRPIINLLFLGPTGVGKTELAKAVAESYFGSEDRMIRLDMSEYQLPDSMARLIGVPGSEQGGILTEAVRQNPFSLLLLDEIEKAHPDILNVFLQVMEDGRLTDALGRTIDFTSVILVGTSNAASLYIQDQVAKKVALETIKDHLIKEELRQNFTPEFLNRFDGIVVFKPLTPEDLNKVAGLLLKKVGARLAEKGINLVVTPEAQEELAQAGFDPVFGARPLRRVIQEKVDNALAQYLLRGAIGRRDTVVLKPGGVVEVDKAHKLT